jgi:uncharacterized membrane protein YdbT with pleckstrin-like domain
VNPDEWQSREEWEKEEAQRRESEELSRHDREREAELRSEWEIKEKERRSEAVTQAVLITLLVVGVVDLFLPGFLYVILFFLGWATAYSVIGKVKTFWIRCVLYVLAPIVLLVAFMWVGGMYREELRRTL